MRKLTPYDDLTCICKEPLDVRQDGGQEVRAASKCECLAFPSRAFPPVRSLRQYEEWVKSQKLKMTRFKVSSVIVTPVEARFV